MSGSQRNLRAQPVRSGRLGCIRLPQSRRLTASPPSHGRYGPDATIRGDPAVRVALTSRRAKTLLALYARIRTRCAKRGSTGSLLRGAGWGERDGHSVPLFHCRRRRKRPGRAWARERLFYLDTLGPRRPRDAAGVHASCLDESPVLVVARRNRHPARTDEQPELLDEVGGAASERVPDP